MTVTYVRIETAQHWSDNKSEKPETRRRVVRLGSTIVAESRTFGEANGLSRHLVAELRNPFKYRGFARAAELSTSNLRDVCLIHPKQLCNCLLGQMSSPNRSDNMFRQ